MTNFDNKGIKLEDRKPVWIALSDLYVDTELQESDYKYMAQVFAASVYDLAKIKEINKYEVFPLLYKNLLGVAGVWTGFQEEWLISKLAKKAGKRHFLRRIWVSVLSLFFGSMYKEDWKKIEKWYTKIIQS